MKNLTQEDIEELKAEGYIDSIMELHYSSHIYMQQGVPEEIE